MLGNQDEGRYAAYVVTANGLIPIDESNLGAALFGGDLATTEEEGPPIDAEAVWNAYLTNAYDLAMPGVTAAVALKIYETKAPVDGVLAQLQVIALETLQEVLNMDEPCCRNAWCARTVLFDLIQRYNVTFGVPAWFQAAMA